MKVCMWAFGAYDYTVALVHALSQHCSADLYCSRYHLRQYDMSILDVLKDKARVVLYDCRRFRDPRSLITYQRICNDIKQNDYDVLHMQEYGPPWMWWPWRIHIHLPFVMTVHDPYQHPGLSRIRTGYQDTMQKHFIHRADRIIVHGEFLKKQFLKRYRKKTPDTVASLAHGNLAILKHFHDEKKPSLRNKKLKTILFLGDIRPNKGLEYLLKAEPLLRARYEHYRIVIAGPCQHFERYRPWIDPQAPIHSDIRYVPNRQLAAYLEEASLVVLPYLSATQTGVIPLAFAYGIPVVATQVGGIPEIVTHGETGWLVPPRDEAALAHAIVELLKNESKRKEMGGRALAYAEEELSWDRIAIQTLEVYRKAMADKGQTTH